MKPKKILCPIDFSPGSSEAMSAAIRIARDSDAEVVLLHVWQVPATTGDYAFAPNAMVDIEEAARGCLDKSLATATSLGAKRISSKLVYGAPWKAIVELLEDRSFDLVVMGTHGRTGMRRFLLGSVAEKVVRHAPCSVLTIRPDAALKAFTNILVPVDFSEDSHEAIECAASVVRPGGAGITLLHVIELPVNYRGEPQNEGMVEALDKRGGESLERWGLELRTKVDIPVRTRTRIGRAGAEVLAVLDEDPSIDLVVTGCHGRTGLSRALMGSVAERIVRYAPCPVLVARRRASTRAGVS